MSTRDRRSRAASAAVAGLAVVLSVTVSGCGGQLDRGEDGTTSSQSWADTYPTIAELTEASDLVARTTVMAVDGWESTEGGSWTDYRVRVDQPVRPSTGAPTEVVVRQSGAAEDTWASSVESDDPLMVVGDEAFLFLTAHDGGYHVSGGPTGRIATDGDALSYLAGSSLEERPVTRPTSSPA